MVGVLVLFSVPSAILTTIYFQHVFSLSFWDVLLVYSFSGSFFLVAGVSLPLVLKRLHSS